jgi:hypothetical protein
MVAITKDYLQLSELSTKKTLPDEFIFKIIAKYDEKYKNNKSHDLSFEGLLSSIGSDQKSIKLLNCVIKRLKEKKERLPQNKYHFDLANTIFSKAEMHFKPEDGINHLLNNCNIYREARSEFALVEKNDLTHFERATTNIANILEKYGRNYEALFMYDRVLQVNPNFGMALGNKAIALEYYIRLAPQQSLLLLNKSYHLLKKALNDDQLAQVGGMSALQHFNNKLKDIEKYFSKIKFSPKKLNPPSTINKYEKFVLTNNLYLNYDFGYYYDKNSLKDNLFPNLQEEISSKEFKKLSAMSKKTYFTFQVFNQILEDYTTARYNYFEALNENYKKIDAQINYISTLDYTRHCLKYGLLKSTFSKLYSCLDKIAHLVRYYFSGHELRESDINIYFGWLTTDEFKQVIKNNNDYQLLALHSLALDFKTNGQYYKLNQIRNRITHSFLNINVGIGYDSEYKNFEIEEERIIEQIRELFLIVKSAILYTIIAINRLSQNNSNVSMSAIMQKDIFKSH